MANEEHLARLKQDVGVWNTWRDANPSIRPDLSEANLIEAALKCGILNRMAALGMPQSERVL
jgi:hypothetical protein